MKEWFPGQDLIYKLKEELYPEDGLFSQNSAIFPEPGKMKPTEANTTNSGNSGKTIMAWPKASTSTTWVVVCLSDTQTHILIM